MVYGCHALGWWCLLLSLIPILSSIDNLGMKLSNQTFSGIAHPFFIEATAIYIEQFRHPNS